MTASFKPEKVAQLLTQNTGSMNPATLSALNDARRRALQRQSMSPVPVSSSRWSSVLSLASGPQGILAEVLALMLLAGTACWYQAREQRIAKLDVAILTDDLPIEVFID